MSWSTFADLLALRADNDAVTDEQLRAEAVGLGFTDHTGQIDDRLLNLCIAEYCYLAGLRRLVDYDTESAVSAAESEVNAAKLAVDDAEKKLIQARHLHSLAARYQERLSQAFHFLPNRNVARDNLAPLSGSTRSLTGYSPTPPGDDTVVVTAYDVALDSFSALHGSDITTFIAAVDSYASTHNLSKSEAAKQLKDNNTASWTAARDEANFAAGRGESFFVT